MTEYEKFMQKMEKDEKIMNHFCEQIKVATEAGDFKKVIELTKMMNKELSL